MALYVNPNSLDNKGSCWILKDFYCSVTMLRDLVVDSLGEENKQEKVQYLVTYVHFNLSFQEILVN